MLTPDEQRGDGPATRLRDRSATTATSSLARRQTWRLRNWIILGYSIPVALSFLSATVVFTQTRLLRNEIESVIERSKINTTIGDFAIDVQSLSLATRGYLLAPNSISERSYRMAAEATEQVAADLDQVLEDTAQQRTFAALLEELDQIETINEDLIAQAKRGDRDGAIAAWQENNGRDKIEQVSVLLSEFRDRETELVRASTVQATSATNNLIRTVWGSTLVSLLFAIAIGAWIIITIAQRMKVTASTLAASTSEIAAAIEQQERTASQQAASVNETTTTMDELGASSRQSSEQAEAAASAAQKALELADSGTKAVDATLASMNSLKDKVGAIAEQILRLSEQTNQIGSISQLVSDLANQTNMLALNAAVEAVRAGEHGKGFAVVAAEIRKLADRSKQSAQKINNLVGDIQHAINSTVMVTDEGTKTVESGAAIAQRTADAFVGVADAVNNVVLNNQQISLNIRQQATAIGQVVQAMNAINQGAKETALGITQTKLGTQTLRDVTAALQDMV